MYYTSFPAKIKPSLLLVCTSLISLITVAQKLPKVQNVSLRAPVDIKIDGKPFEWHNNYQADNAGCRIFYSLCNDDVNLYLVVRTKGIYGNQKILQGGITFKIDLASKGKKPALVSVNYPAVLSKGDMEHDILQNHARRYYTGLSSDTLTNKREIDSLIKLTNSEFVSLFKDIQISGIKGITDSVISVYNDAGIKAMAGFDSKMLYTYELAIPLKYLSESINAGNKFRYNIKLNAQATILVSGVFAPPVVLPDVNSVVFPDGTSGKISPDDMYVNNPTDFWGNYTLTKK